MEMAPLGLLLRVLSHDATRDAAYRTFTGQASPVEYQVLVLSSSAIFGLEYKQPKVIEVALDYQFSSFLSGYHLFSLYQVDSLGFFSGVRVSL